MRSAAASSMLSSPVMIAMLASFVIHQKSTEAIDLMRQTQHTGQSNNDTIGKRKRKSEVYFSFFVKF